MNARFLAILTSKLCWSIISLIKRYLPDGSDHRITPPPYNGTPRILNNPWDPLPTIWHDTDNWDAANSSPFDLPLDPIPVRDFHSDDD
jgi:hypothetical protein